MSELSHTCASEGYEACVDDATRCAKKNPFLSYRNAVIQITLSSLLLFVKIISLFVQTFCSSDCILRHNLLQ